MRHLGRVGIVLVLLFLAAWEMHAETPTLPLVMANDNRTPAGQLENGVLELRLELRQGCWYPEDENGDHRYIYAFAEEGHPPQSSGPLIRVLQGTQIHATIHNTLALAAKDLWPASPSRRYERCAAAGSGRDARTTFSCWRTGHLPILGHDIRQASGAARPGGNPAFWSLHRRRTWSENGRPHLCDRYLE